jgi:hypothetical protein
MKPLTLLFTSRKRSILGGVLSSTVAIAVFLSARCGSKNDAINQAEKHDAVNGVPVPSLAETKTIGVGMSHRALARTRQTRAVVALYIRSTESEGSGIAEV